MFRPLVGRLSFGGRFGAAALFYFGLGLIILGLSPRPTVAHASGDCSGEDPCGEGYFCCHGTCIPEDYVCCDDGTNGPAETCVCCTGCTEECSDPSTLVCE